MVTSSLFLSLFLSFFSLSLSLSFSLSLSLFLLSLTLSLTLTLSHSDGCRSSFKDTAMVPSSLLSLSLFLYLSLSHSDGCSQIFFSGYNHGHIFSLSRNLALSLSLSRARALSPSLSRALSHSLLPLSSPSLSFCLSHALVLSPSLYLSISLSHSDGCAQLLPASSAGAGAAPMTQCGSAIPCEPISAGVPSGGPDQNPVAAAPFMLRWRRSKGGTGGKRAWHVSGPRCFFGLNISDGQMGRAMRLCLGQALTMHCSGGCTVGLPGPPPPRPVRRMVVGGVRAG